MTALVVNAVVDRLKTNAPSLEQRVSFAADLAALSAANILPRQTPAAYVISLGEDAEASPLMNATRQRIVETVGIVLIHAVKGDAAKGERAQATIDAIGDEIKATLIGWETSSLAPFELRRVRALGMAQGAVMQQLEFTTFHLIYGG